MYMKITSLFYLIGVFLLSAFCQSLDHEVGNPLTVAIELWRPVRVLEKILGDCDYKCINTADRLRRTPLMLALSTSQWNTTRFLIDQGSDVLQSARVGYLFLQPLEQVFAVEAPSDLIIHMIRAIPGNLDAIESVGGVHMIYMAIVYHRLDLIPYFLERKMSVLDNSKPEHTAIWLAASKRGFPPQLLKQMLESAVPEKLEQFLNTEGDILMEALRNKNWDCAKILLEFGANAALRNENFISPVYQAVLSGADVELLETMLQSQESGPILRTLNCRFSPLLAAIERQRWDVVKTFHRFGASLIGSHFQHSLICPSINAGVSADALKDMLKNEAPTAIAHAINDGERCLMTALRRKNWAVAMLLLDYGADAIVFQKDASSVFQAVKSGAPINLLEKLMEGSEKQGTTHYLNTGCNPLSEALIKKNWEAVKLLLKFGVDPTREDVFGSPCAEAECLLYGSSDQDEEIKKLLKQIIHPPWRNAKSAMKV